jgi:hypothetical protein
MRVSKAADKRASFRKASWIENSAGSPASRGPSSDAHVVTVAEATQRHRAAEQALRQGDLQAVRCAKAVYLNGDALDRGVLCLTKHSLRFDGWQGRIVIPVRDILEVRLGTSVLPRHAGIPLVGRIWPGRPRYAESLLLTVRVGSAVEPRVATVADLRNGIQWRDEILRCRDDYEAWTEERSRRVEEIRAAEEDLKRARQADAVRAADDRAQDTT